MNLHRSSSHVKLNSAWKWIFFLVHKFVRRNEVKYGIKKFWNEFFFCCLNINFQKYFFISHSCVPYHIFTALLIVDVSHYVLLSDGKCTKFHHWNSRNFWKKHKKKINFFVQKQKWKWKFLPSKCWEQEKKIFLITLQKGDERSKTSNA